MKSIDIRTGVRTLRAEWTSEMVQDLNLLHGYNIEKEFNKLLKIEKRKNSIKNIFSI